MSKKAVALVAIIVLVAIAVFVRTQVHGGSLYINPIYINPDGSVQGTAEGISKIQRNGNVYTLTGNLSGGIQVQRSHIVIDGAGYTIDGNGGGRGIDLTNGRGQEPSRPEVINVTVKNLRILNFYYGIDNVNTHGNTFIGNYIENCENSFWMGGYDNLITGNTMNNASIAINFAGSNNITKNNFMNSWVMVWLSTQPIVDENYWSDYSVRYPDAKEIDNTGVWDTPYEYYVVDNHPLTKPTDSSLQEPTTPNVEPLQTVPIAIIAVSVMVVGVGIVVYLKKRFGHFLF
jgi:hypothetical protein